MTKMTSAYANKILKKLQDDKQYLLSKECNENTYECAEGEEALIPDYSYEETRAKLAEIEEKIVTIKHAVNVANTTSKLTVDGKELTVDSILVRMAMLNSRRDTLSSMRLSQPKTRMRMITSTTGKNVPEYRYLNYDVETVKKDYEMIDSELAKLQLALDNYNHTCELEVDIDI